MERFDCTERKLLRRLLGYFWPGVCHNEDLYAEIDVVCRRMTRGKHQHLAPPSKVAKVNRLRFFGHILRRPADRLVQLVLRSSSGSSWKKPPGRKRKFWTEAMKEDLRTLGVDRQFRRDVRFRRIWNSGEWTDSMQALAEDREGWAELCSRTAHLGEDADGFLPRPWENQENVAPVDGDSSLLRHTFTEDPFPTLIPTTPEPWRNIETADGQDHFNSRKERPRQLPGLVEMSHQP
ncbi:hypothetical protein RB195_019206 [Necator americanus]